MLEAYFDVTLAVACVFYKTKTCVTYFLSLICLLQLVTYFLDEICLLRLWLNQQCLHIEILCPWQLMHKIRIGTVKTTSILSKDFKYEALLSFLVKYLPYKVNFYGFTLLMAS